MGDGEGKEHEIDGKGKEKMMVCEEFQTLEETHQMGRQH